MACRSVPARFASADVGRNTLPAVLTVPVTHHWETQFVSVTLIHTNNSSINSEFKNEVTSHWFHIWVLRSRTGRYTGSWPNRCLHADMMARSSLTHRYKSHSSVSVCQCVEGYCDKELNVPVSQVCPLYPAGHSHMLGFTHLPLFLQSGRHTAERAEKRQQSVR